MKQKQKQKDSKLPFGPTMTESIFATKWMSKFRPLLHDGFIKPDDPSTSRVWMCIFCEQVWNHVVHFHAQAAALSLTAADFPPDAKVGSEVWYQGSRPFGDWFLKGICNPFPVAGMLQGLTDQFLQRFEAMKTKGEDMYGTRWQDLPMKRRKRVNELIPLVKKAKEEGWWVDADPFFVDDKFKKWEDEDTFR